MKILQINCVYGSGSTGNIVKDLHTYYLNKGIDSKVIYGRGVNIDNVNLYKCATEFLSKSRNLISRFTGNIYGMGKVETKRIVDYIEHFKPDIVHLHCINGHFCNIYTLIKYLKENSVNTVITLHAEFLYTGNCGYAYDCIQWKNKCINCPNVKMAIGSFNKKATKTNWEKMYESFNNFDNNIIIVGVSDWISERALESSILKNKKVMTVLNGINTTVFNRKYKLPNLIYQKKKEGNKIVLHITPYFEDKNKGGQWVIKLANILKNEKIHFIVIGKAKRNYNIANVSFIGQINDQGELARYYQYSDITLLTSKRETFSMVCAESLCCGTPIVGFYAGAPERIALENFSDFIDYGDIVALKEKILDWLSKDVDRINLSNEAIKTYSKEKMAENYLSIYKKMIGVK